MTLPSQAAVRTSHKTPRNGLDVNGHHSQEAAEEKGLKLPAPHRWGAPKELGVPLPKRQAPQTGRWLGFHPGIHRREQDMITQRWVDRSRKHKKARWEEQQQPQQLQPGPKGLLPQASQPVDGRPQPYFRRGGAQPTRQPGSPNGWHAHPQHPPPIPQHPQHHYPRPQWWQSYSPHFQQPQQQPPARPRMAAPKPAEPAELLIPPDVTVSQLAKLLGGVHRRALVPASILSGPQLLAAKSSQCNAEGHACLR